MRYLSNIFLCVDIELSLIKNSAKEWQLFCNSTQWLDRKISRKWNVANLSRVGTDVGKNCCKFEEFCKKGEEWIAKSSSIEPQNESQTAYITCNNLLPKTFPEHNEIPQNFKTFNWTFVDALQNFHKNQHAQIFDWERIMKEGNQYGVGPLKLSGLEISRSWRQRKLHHVVHRPPVLGLLDGHMVTTWHCDRHYDWC